MSTTTTTTTPPYVHVYLFCYNELRLLPVTVGYYRRVFPNCKITICDNCSTDGSVDLAITLGCDIYSFSTDRYLNEFVHKELRNNLWKNSSAEWIVFCDMDELVMISEADLVAESSAGTNLIRTEGRQVLARCEDPNASDIDDLLSLDRYVFDKAYSKPVCFRRLHVPALDFEYGGHSVTTTTCTTDDTDAKCEKYSERTYPLWHFNYLGVPWLLRKNRDRFARATIMRKYGMSTHYVINPEQVVRDLDERWDVSIIAPVTLRAFVDSLVM